MTTTDEGVLTEIQEIVRRMPDLARVNRNAIMDTHGVTLDVVNLCLDEERRRRRAETLVRDHTDVIPSTLAEYVFVRYVERNGFTRGTSNGSYARRHHVTDHYVRAVRQFDREGHSLTTLAELYESPQRRLR